MLRVRVSTASAEIIETELITAGRRGLECGFEFNSAWNGLAKTVIVNGVVKRDIVLVSDSITVPGECLAREQFPLRIGVYGANGAGEIVIPTIWANFGKILPSARPSGIDPDEVTPDIVAQIQTNSSDALRLAQDLLRRADSGEFDGRDGATGPRGETGDKGDKGDAGNGIWWAEASHRIVQSPDSVSGLIMLRWLVGKPDAKPQKGDFIVFDDFDIWTIDAASVYSAGIDRRGSIKGDAFTYDDFTPAQLEALTGPQGATGQQGPKGDKGDKGDTGIVWTSTQVSLLQNLFARVKFDTPNAQQYVDALITSLAANPQWNADQITLLDTVLDHVKYIDETGDEVASMLITALRGGVIPAVVVPSTAEDVGAVAEAQGVENAGKFLVVGDDGNITTVAVPSASGVSF